jgi:hypothetical protein
MRENSAMVQRVYFEVTNACNFRCDFCPICVSTRRPRCMDLSLFQAGVDQIAERRIADSVGFHVLGEPLLYPHILDAVGYARAQGLRTGLTTNGSMLTADRVQGLLDAGLHALNISLQMIGPEAHECRESGLSYEEYLQRVMGALSQMRRANHRPEVEIMTMGTWSRPFFDVDRPMRLSGGGQGTADRLACLFHEVHLALGMRVSRDDVRRSVRRLSPLMPWRVRVDESVSVSMLPFMDWGNAFTTRKVHPAPFGYCNYLMNNIGVLSNGEVTVCCGDYDGKTSLGNLADSPLSMLLESEPAQAMKRGLQHLRLVHPHCGRCLGSTNPIRAAFKGLASACVFKRAQSRTKQTRFTTTAPAESGEVAGAGPVRIGDARFSSS